MTRPSPKVTNGELWHRAMEGIYRVILRGGRYAGTRHKPDNSALLALAGRIDRITAPPPSGVPSAGRSHK